MISAAADSLRRLSPGEIDRLKIFGALLMVIDHIDGIWFLRGAVDPAALIDLMGGENFELMRSLMWLIGRSVYPIFCLVLALHLTAGRLRSEGLMRLLLIGLAVQPLFWWARREARLVTDPDLSIFAMAVPLNVFVTLALGGLIAIAFVKLPRAQAHLWAGLGCVIGLTAPHAMNVVEYLVPGVLLPALIGRWLVARDNWFAGWSALALIGCNMSAASWATPATATTALFAGLFAFGGILGSVWLARLIRGERRFIGRWSFYVFYPGHYLLLTLIGLLVFRP